MNAVDQMLSDAADVVERSLDEDHALAADTEALLEAEQHPTVCRTLPQLGPHAVVTIVISKQ